MTWDTRWDGAPHFMKMKSDYAHPINLVDLPDLSQDDDFGEWCLWKEDYPFVLYDDINEWACACDALDCCIDFEPDTVDETAWTKLFCKCGQENCKRRGKNHSPGHGPRCSAICWVEGDPQRVMEVSFMELTKFPDTFTPPVIRPSTREGFLYMAASQPDLSLHRLKCGWTSDPAYRMQQYRTLCPRILLLGLWDADAVDEKWFHQNINGERFNTSEEFHVFEPFKEFAEMADRLERYRRGQL